MKQLNISKYKNSPALCISIMTHSPITLSHPSFSTRLSSYRRPYSLDLPSFQSIEMRNKDNPSRHEWAGAQLAQIEILSEFSLANSNISVVRAWGYLHCKCRNTDRFFSVNGGENKLVKVLLEHLQSFVFSGILKTANVQFYSKLW